MALLQHLGIARADLLGYSMGGGVALRTAIEHPEVVRKLVLISFPFKRAAYYPEVLAVDAHLGPQAAAFMKHSPLAQLYPRVDWSMLFTRIGELRRTDYDWSNEVAAIQAPTLIVFADADAVRPSHVVELFGLLGGGRKDAGLDGSGRPAAQLAILPGFTHYNVLTCPALATFVNLFLDAPVREPRDAQAA